MNIAEMDKKGAKIQRMYFELAIPLVCSMVVTLIYNVADTYFVAASGNTNLIAGVSLGAPVLTLLMAVGNVYGQGGSSLISRLIGKNDIKAVREASADCFYLSVLSGIVLGAIMLVFLQPIVYMLGADSETYMYASQYYRWLSVGAPFIILSFVVSNLLRSEGRSRQSMTVSISGVVINIILDPIFITVLGLGAAGAAMATVIGYVVLDVYGLCVVAGKSTLLSLNPADLKTGGRHLGPIYTVGIPAAITNVMHTISQIFVNQFLQGYGNDKIAAMGIALKVALIVTLIMTGLAFGGLPIFGYYYGAGNKKRFMELTRFCIKFICITAACMSAVIFAAAPVLIRFFVEDESLISAGTLMLRCMVPTMAFGGLVMQIQLIFQSMGKVKQMFSLSISRQGVVYLVVLFIASRLAGYYGILISQAISDIVSGGIAVTMFLLWRKNYLGEEQLIRKHKSCSSLT